MAKLDVRKYSMIGLGVGVVSWILGFFYKLFSGAGEGQVQTSLDFAPIADGVKQQIQAGVPTDLASQIIGWLSGALKVDVAGLVTLAVAGITIVLLGAFIFNMLNIKALMKTSIRRLVSIAVIGTLVSGLIVSFLAGNTQIPAFMGALTMTLYFIVVAFAYQGLARLSKGTPASKIFIEA